MADHIPAFACGWESGHVTEANHIDAGPSLGTSACFSVVAAAGTLMQGSYMLNIDYTATEGSMARNLSMGAASSGAVGFNLEFVANASGADNGIIGMDNQALNGWFLYRRTSDQKLYIGDSSMTSKVVSTNAYTTGEYHIQVKWTPRTVEVRVYDSTLSLAEEFSVFFVQSASNTLRIGQVVGNPDGGEYNMDNVYVIKTAGAWPPIHPTFAALPVNADSVNDADVFAGDTGADATPNEYQRIDEIPPTVSGTPDYLYKNTGGASTAQQFYGHAGFGLGTPEFITVGVINLFERSANAIAFLTSRIRLSTSVLVPPTSGAFNTSNGFRYEHSGFWITKPGGGAWAAADVDNALPGQGIVNFTGGTHVRCHQTIIYAIYGDDVEIDRPTFKYATMVG